MQWKGHLLACFGARGAALLGSLFSPPQLAEMWLWFRDLERLGRGLSAVMSHIYKDVMGDEGTWGARTAPFCVSLSTLACSASSGEGDMRFFLLLVPCGAGRSNF